MLTNLKATCCCASKLPSCQAARLPGCSVARLLGCLAAVMAFNLCELVRRRLVVRTVSW